MSTSIFTHSKDIPIEILCQLASTHLSNARTLALYYSQSGKKDYTDINELLRLANEVLDEILIKLPLFMNPIQNLQGDIGQTLLQLESSFFLLSK